MLVGEWERGGAHLLLLILLRLLPRHVLLLLIISVYLVLTESLERLQRLYFLQVFNFCLAVVRCPRHRGIQRANNDLMASLVLLQVQLNRRFGHRSLRQVLRHQVLLTLERQRVVFLAIIPLTSPIFCWDASGLNVLGAIEIV